MEYPIFQLYEKFIALMRFRWRIDWRLICGWDTGAVEYEKISCWCWQFSRFTDYSDKSNKKDRRKYENCWKIHSYLFFRRASAAISDDGKMFIFSYERHENLVHQKFHFTVAFSVLNEFVWECLQPKSERVNTENIIMCMGGIRSWFFASHALLNLEFHIFYRRELYYIFIYIKK